MDPLLLPGPQGDLPSGSETVIINAAVGSSTLSEHVCWLNPFGSMATVRVALSSDQPPGTFNLLLPGTQQAASNTLQYAANTTCSSRWTAAGQDSDSSAAGADDEQYLERAESDPRLRSLRAVGRSRGQDPSAGEAASALMAMVEAFGSRNSQHSGAVGDQGTASGDAHGPNRPEAAPVMLQQVAEASVAAHGRLLLPVAFNPLVLREAAAGLTVCLVAPAMHCRAPLEWQYDVKGLAHSGITLVSACNVNLATTQKRRWLSMYSCVDQCMQQVMHKQASASCSVSHIVYA